MRFGLPISIASSFEVCGLAVVAEHDVATGGDVRIDLLDPGRVGRLAASAGPKGRNLYRSRARPRLASEPRYRVTQRVVKPAPGGCHSHIRDAVGANLRPHC